MNCTIQILVGIVILLLSFNLQWFRYPQVWLSKNLLVIGILSAPENFEARQSIRNTWVNLLDRKDTEYYFIIGKPCALDPVDRKSNFSCDELRINWPQNEEYDSILWTAYASEENTHNLPLVTSFSFRVNYPIILKSVSITKNLSNTLKNTSSFIEVKNARTQEIILRINCSLFVHSSNSESFSRILPRPFILTKGFEIEVKMISALDFSRNGQNLGYYSWSNAHGAIQFLTLYEPSVGSVLFNNFSCSFVSLGLSLHDLKTHFETKQMRTENFLKNHKSFLDELEKESLYKKDILNVQAIDVYRNLPLKMMLFYKWVIDNLEFDFLLKTDDDTFLNVPLVVENLKRSKEIHQQGSIIWWWAKFRFGLPVERFGKWQELDYQAPIYPPFPCGGGYVLNHQLVSFLAKNSDWLYMFQGEDTSLGIWLSGVHPTKPSEMSCDWSCGETCTAKSCNKGQLSVAQMVEAWDIYQNCSTICDC